MKPSSTKKPFYLAIFASTLALGVVMLGAYTRLVDAGLGCPDWPGCYGKLLVPTSKADISDAQHLFPTALFDASKAWPEMIHRYFAGILGLFVLCLIWMAWNRRSERQVPLKLSFFLGGLIVVQALFGKWTVSYLLAPWVVLMHLLGGILTFTLLWLITLAWGNVSIRKVRSSILTVFNPWMSFALGLMALQIALGGLTAANYAGLACPDFPTCQGVWVPPIYFASAGGIPSLFDDPITIHFMHRLGALLCVVFVGGVALSLILSAPRFFAQLGSIVLVLLLVQTLLGILNVLWQLPLWTAVLHNGVAALLLVFLATIRYYLFLYASSSRLF